MTDDVSFFVELLIRSRSDEELICCYDLAALSLKETDLLFFLLSCLVVYGEIKN